VTRVRSATGEILECCWDECSRAGMQEHREVEVEGPNTVTYIFCNDQHRALWANSYRSYGNAPAGNRTPLGLWLPTR
jgi:hypothetical protein